MAREAAIWSGKVNQERQTRMKTSDGVGLPRGNKLTHAGGTPSDKFHTPKLRMARCTEKVVPRANSHTGMTEATNIRLGYFPVDYETTRIVKQNKTKNTKLHKKSIVQY